MSLLGMLTGAIDSFVGGQIMKATLTVDKDNDPRAKELAGVELTFQFNPEKIKITRAQARTSTPVMGKDQKQEDQAASPQNESTLVLGEVTFDTYEQKPNKSVYTEYIAKLEKFVGSDRHKHAPPQLLFTWGKFSEGFKDKNRLTGKLESLDVEYTMFLNDGTPVRAKTNLTLRLGPPADAQTDPNSPDHAKLVTVRRGDSLSDIAYREYDNTAEWRRIADANGIDDPLVLVPGTKIVVPPILH